MRILERYIFKEVATPSAIALVALTFVVFIREIGALVEVMVRGAATAEDVWNICVAIIPNALVFTIPMAVLVGILTGLGRISSDAEATALRATGVSMRQVILPVLLMAAIGWAAGTSVTLFTAPGSAARLRDLRFAVASRQESIHLKARVFNEDLGQFILYIRDVPPQGSVWNGIFLADMRDPEQPSVTFAERGAVIYREASGDSPRHMELTLTRGSTHIVSSSRPDRYSFTQFATTTIPIPIPDPPPYSGAILPPQIPSDELWSRVRSGRATGEEQVELHRRLALPFACMVFALVGVPLGIPTRRGGRSVGLVLSLMLMLTYYLMFAGGSRIAANSTTASALGAWFANIVFLMLGAFLVARSDRSTENRAIGHAAAGLERVRERIRGWRIGERFQRLPVLFSITGGAKWIRLLDLYVLRGFWFFFGIVLTVFVALFVIVTLFELLPDIVKNDVPAGVVLSYFLFLLPQIVYWVIPLTVLMAVLINLGTLTQANETLAVKAGAVSLYRLAMPLVIMGLGLSAGIYLLQDFMLPYANQRQDEFRSIIKGRAPQTYRDPGRKWMVGSDGRIYNYTFFDPARNVFGGLSVFELRAEAFELKRWMYTSRAHWEPAQPGWAFDSGWIRSFDPQGKIGYQAFPSLGEVPSMDPPDYFKKEVRTASQMTYSELKSYVEDLQDSGFDVTDLMVDLNRKLSFPMVSLIMAVIGIPFSFTTGRRGAFYGIGMCVLVGIVYWSTFEFFDKLGGINQLSPAIAAWFPNLIFGLTGTWMLLRVRT